MSTPSGYPGTGSDPYGAADPQKPAGSNPYTQPGGYPATGNYPPPGQYPYQQASAPGYPPAGAYGVQSVTDRPTLVTVAAVTAFVVGGLNILSGLIWLFAGGVIGYVSSGWGVFFTVTAIGTFVVGGAYIYAGLQVLTGKNAKYLVIVVGVDVLLRLLVLIAFFFTSLSIVGFLISVAIIALLMQPQSRDWFRAKGAPAF